MGIGDFTKEEAKEAKLTVNEIFNGLSKSKRKELLSHLNQACLFIEAALRAAPSEETIRELASNPEAKKD